LGEATILFSQQVPATALETCAGATRTERTDAATEKRAASNAIRRIVDASEIAQVVTFLASTKAANVTGIAIDASGGSIPVMFQ